MKPLAGSVNRVTQIKIVLFSISLLPGLKMAGLLYQEIAAVNPLAELMGTSGSWTLIFLLLTLLVSPLRFWVCWICLFFHVSYGKRLSDWNWLIKCRRMLGLFCFFYACVHLFFYLWLEMGFLIDEVLLDFNDRLFLPVGFAAFILLLPLAITSLEWFRIRLGKNWRRLHRSTYLVAILAMIHFVMLTKVGNNRPLYYGLILGVLLGHRLLMFLRPGSLHPKNYAMEHTR
jgi:methionine sulfoxide reductase heme-binding subunit